MKHYIATVFLATTITLCYGQVNQLVYLENGQNSKVEYVGQTEDTYQVIQTSEKQKGIIKLDKNEIRKIQTLGIHFQKDEYDDFLSNNNKKIEFQKLCHNSSYGVYISGRKINDTIVLLIKLKFGKTRKTGPLGLSIYDGDGITFILESGESITLSLSNTYLLEGYGLYNFGYAIPNNQQFFQLLNSPIEKVYIEDQKCNMNDKYCIMRHLLALMDN